MSLRVAKCPISFFPVGGFINEDFEHTNDYYNTGTIDRSTFFCGGQSYKNPWRIYPYKPQQLEIELKTYMSFYVSTLLLLKEKFSCS